eukprot:6144668-Pleurochrysis_carterae.AAC.3
MHPPCTSACTQACESESYERARTSKGSCAMAREREGARESEQQPAQKQRSAEKAEEEGRRREATCGVSTQSDAEGQETET